MATDDLEANTFFQTLKKKYPDLYSKVSTQCLSVLAPRNQCLFGIKLTRDFMETHIIRPSPYYQGTFETLNSKSLTVEDHVITTGEGFSSKRSVDVVYEELFYNSNYQSFRVLCLNRSLEGTASAVPVAGPNEEYFAEKRSLKDHIQFLRGDRNNLDGLQVADRSIQQFNTSYVIVEGYVPQVKAKIDSICQNTVQRLLTTNPRLESCTSNKKHMSVLSQAVSSYVLHGVHSRLFSGLKAIYAKQDGLLATVCQSLQNISMDSLGISAHIHCELPAAIRHISRLNCFTTPLEKLESIRDTSKAITQGVADALMARHPKDKKASSYALSTDDLLPLLIFTVIRSNLPFLYTNSVYLDYFYTCESTMDEYGFFLANFKAVVEYLAGDASASKVGMKCASKELKITYSLPPSNPIVALAPAERSPKPTSTTTASTTSNRPSRRHTIDASSSSRSGPFRGSSNTWNGPSFNTRDKPASNGSNGNNGSTGGSTHSHFHAGAGSSGGAMGGGGTAGWGSQSELPSVIGPEDGFGGPADDLGDFLSGLRASDDIDSRFL